MKKTIDFEQQVINEVMALAWDLKIYDFGPVARLLVAKGLEYRDDIVSENA
jgi:hypothetical protein